jgi:flagellar motor switch protein FliN/FliY
VTLTLENRLEPIWLTFSPWLLATIAENAVAADSGGEHLPGSGAEEPAPRAHASSRTMDLLLDVELPVSISFGKTQLPMKEVLKLTTGSIVELDRSVGDPVEVLVNDSLVARGEVVVIDGNYGVRIQKIINPQDRLRSLR